MIKKQIIRAREHFMKDLVEREEIETFNITYYPPFQNVRNIMQELHLLIAPDKDHKKVFPNVPVVQFHNSKSLKDYLIRATLTKTNEIGRCEPCRKKTCLVRNLIRITSIFTTKACGKTFKIQSDPRKNYCTF